MFCTRGEGLSATRNLPSPLHLFHLLPFFPCLTSQLPSSVIQPTFISLPSPLLTWLSPLGKYTPQEKESGRRCDFVCNAALGCRVYGLMACESFIHEALLSPSSVLLISASWWAGWPGHYWEKKPPPPTFPPKYSPLSSRLREGRGICKIRVGIEPVGGRGNSPGPGWFLVLGSQGVLISAFTHE